MSIKVDVVDMYRNKSRKSSSVYSHEMEKEWRRWNEMGNCRHTWRWGLENIEHGVKWWREREIFCLLEKVDFWFFVSFKNGWYLLWVMNWCLTLYFWASYFSHRKPKNSDHFAPQTSIIAHKLLNFFSQNTFFFLSISRLRVGCVVGWEGFCLFGFWMPFSPAHLPLELWPYYQFCKLQSNFHYFLELDKR